VRADEGTLIENLKGTYGPLGMTAEPKLSPGRRSLSFWVNPKATA